MKQFKIINPKLIFSILGLGIGLVIALGVIGTNAQIILSAPNTDPTKEVTPAVGGSGGNPTGLKACPKGQLALGFEGKEVTDPASEVKGLLTDYRTLCGTFEVDYTTGTIKTTNVPFLPGNDIRVGGNLLVTKSTDFKSILCPIDSVLSGFVGNALLTTKYPVKLIDALRPRCSKITIDATTKLLIVGVAFDQGTEFVPSPPAPASINSEQKVADCESGYVVRGFQGFTGEMFDSFQLSCAKLVQASVEFSIVAPNYADYSVLTTDLDGNPVDIKHKTPQLLVPGNYKFTLKNNVTGKIYSDFKCTGTTPTSTTPSLNVTLANGDSVMCTAIGAPYPPIISTIDTKAIADGVESTIVDTTPLIEGKAAKNADLEIKDAAGKVICLTKSDADGVFKCTPATAFTAGSYKLSVNDTTNQLSGNIAMIKFEDVTTKPVVTPVVDIPAKVTTTAASSSATKSTSTAATTVTPRTGGQSFTPIILIGMVGISIIGLYLLKPNLKK